MYGIVTISTTTTSNRKHYLVIYAEHDYEEVWTQPQFKLLIKKCQNWEIKIQGFCEYEGMFYSEIVESYHSTKSDTQVYHLNYGKLREHTLEKLKEWNNLINLDKHKACKGTL